MYKTSGFACISLIAYALLTGANARATLVSSFESGLDGWEVSGFNGRLVTLSQSTVGVTDGGFSLRVAQEGDGFSWDLKREGFSSSPDAFYNAMNQASVNESLWRLEMDVTYRAADIPNASAPLPVQPQFMNLSFWINSLPGDAGSFRVIHSQALNYPQHDETVHISIPLSDFSGVDELSSNSSFYQLGIGVNGDWGGGTAALYLDNIRLNSVTPIPEPTTGLFGAAVLGAVTSCRRRRRK